MDEEKGFLSSEPGSKSTTRLLSIIITIGGLVIFAGATAIALRANQDIGSNIGYCCVAIIALGLGVKNLGALIERKK